MQRIRKFKADDGSEFITEAECIAHDALCALLALTEEQRTKVLSHFCRSCGTDDPRCQCWNDE